MESPRQKKRKKSPVSALEVADFLLFLQAQHLNEKPSTAPKKMDQLKLQNLLYYVQGYNVGIYGEKAFEEDILRWGFGLVVYDVWKEYKNFGKKPIDNPGKETIFDPQLKQLVSAVWKIFSSSTGSQLVDKIHKEDLWMEANPSSPISLKSFQTEFSKVNHLHSFVQISPKQEARAALARSLRREIRRSFIDKKTLEQVENSFRDSLALLGEDKGEAFYPIEFEQDDLLAYVYTLRHVQWSLVGAAKYEHPRALYQLSRIFLIASIGMPKEFEEKLWKVSKALEKRAFEHCGKDLVLKVWLEKNQQKSKELVQESKDDVSEEFILLGIALCGTKFAEKYNVEDMPKVKLELTRRNQKMKQKKKAEESLSVAEKYSSALGFHRAGIYFQECNPPDLVLAFGCFRKASDLGHGESSCRVIRYLLQNEGLTNPEKLAEAEELANKMKEENGDLNGFTTIAEIIKGRQGNDRPYWIKAGRSSTFRETEEMTFASMVECLPTALTHE